MSKIGSPPPLLLQPLCFSFFLIFSQLFLLSHGDVGTSAHYSPPYLPTACYGSDPTQFPTSNLFGAAGDGIWDDGASCGRLYLVRCISANVTGSCVPGQTIQIRIIDYALTSPSEPSSSGTTMVLSDTAFGTIANSSASSITIEFQQLLISLPLSKTMFRSSFLLIWYDSCKMFGAGWMELMYVVALRTALNSSRRNFSLLSWSTLFLPKSSSFEHESLSKRLTTHFVFAYFMLDFLLTSLMSHEQTMFWFVLRRKFFVSSHEQHLFITIAFIFVHGGREREREMHVFCSLLFMLLNCNELVAKVRWNNAE